MGSKQKQEFSEQPLISKTDGFLLKHRYPNLEIYYSLTAEAHMRVRALYYLNNTGIILTSDKIVKLIGAENFSNLFILCKEVKDIRTRLLLIMGMLTEEKLVEQSKPLTTILKKLVERRRKLRQYAKEVQLKKSNKNTEPSPEFDLKFDLHKAHMKRLNILNDKSKKNATEKLLSVKQNPVEIPLAQLRANAQSALNEVEKNEEITQMGTNEVIQNQGIAQSGTNEGVKDEGILVPGTNEVIQNEEEELSQLGINKVVKNEGTSQLGTNKVIRNEEEKLPRLGINEVIKNEEITQLGINEVVKNEGFSQSETFTVSQNEGIAQSGTNEGVKNDGTSQTETLQAIQNDGLAHSGTNEVVRNEGITQSTANEGVKNEGTSQTGTLQAIQNDGLAHSGTNEVVQNEGITQSTANEGVKNEGMLKSRRNEVVQNEVLSQSRTIEVVKNEGLSQSGTNDMNINEVVQNDEVSQSGTNEVVQNEGITKSGTNKVTQKRKIKGDIFSKIRKAAKSKSVQKLSKIQKLELCRNLKDDYSPEDVAENLTIILHDTLFNITDNLAHKVLCLVNSGADALAKVKGRTALHVIAEKSTAEMAGLAINCIIKSAQQLRTKYRIKSIGELIGHSFDDQGYNPLMVAALSCNDKVLEVFLQAFPQLVDVNSQDGNVCSALTLVTIKAIESHIPHRDFNKYKQVIQLLRKCKANPYAAFLKLKSSYLKDISKLQHFFAQEFGEPIKPFNLKITEEKIIKLSPQGRIVRNFQTNEESRSLETMPMSSVNTNVIEHSVTTQKYIEKSTSQETKTNEMASKKEKIPGYPSRLAENFELEGKAPNLTKMFDIQYSKLMEKVIINSEQLKHIPEVTKSSEPVKSTPVLVKINKGDIGTKFKVVPMADLKRGNLQFKILNNDLLAMESTKDIAESSLKIIKVESNVDHFQSVENNKPSTTAKKECENPKLVTETEGNSNFKATVKTEREEEKFVPNIVKTELADEKNRNDNISKMSFGDYPNLNKDACSTKKIGIKRSAESYPNDPFVKNKISKRTVVNKSINCAENPIGNNKNIENFLEKTESLRLESITDLFEDTREINELLTGNVEDKISFASSNAESEEDNEVKTKMLTNRQNIITVDWGGFQNTGRV